MVDHLSARQYRHYADLHLALLSGNDACCNRLCEPSDCIAEGVGEVRPERA